MKVQTFVRMCGVCVILQGVLSLAQVTTGTISGTVTDPTGAVIPGSTITVRNVETGITRIISTDAAGRYTAQQLGLGGYEVTAGTAGFQTTVRAGIELTVGRQAVVDFTLRVGAVAETVTVTGEAPLLETTNATVADLVTESQMRDLPLNGRSFTNLVALQPGVVTDLGIPQGVFQGGGRMSLNGARPQQSLYLLDGTDICGALLECGSCQRNVPGVGSGHHSGILRFAKQLWSPIWPCRRWHHECRHPFGH